MHTRVHSVYGVVMQEREAKESPMDFDDMVELLDDGATCTVLLTCGHRHGPVSSRTSWFDFPDEAVECAECGDAERQMDVRLQAMFNDEIVERQRRWDEENS